MKHSNEINEPLSAEYRQKIMNMASVELAKNKKKKVFNWFLIPTAVATAALSLVITFNKPEITTQKIAKESIEDLTDLGEMEMIQNLDILEETL